MGTSASDNPVEASAVGHPQSRPHYRGEEHRGLNQGVTMACSGPHGRGQCSRAWLQASLSHRPCSASQEPEERQLSHTLVSQSANPCPFHTQDGAVRAVKMAFLGTL